MRKLPLIIKHNWKDKLSEIKNLQRQHHTIILDCFTYNQPELVDIAVKTGKHVRLLELDHIMIGHESFAKFLSAFPMLEKIIFSNSVLSPEQFEKTSTKIKKLKTLVMVRSDFRILEYFTGPQIQVQELKIASKDYTPREAKHFEKFMEIQTNLKNLAIRMSQSGLIRSLGKIELKFRLKKLAVDYRYWGNDPAVDEIFIKFLDGQKSTLEDLETEKGLSEKLVQFIMKSLKIKRFVVDGHGLTYTPFLFNSIRPNKHLKTLLIEGELLSLDVARGLLGVYPCVEKLVIKSWNSEFINDVILLIANNLKRLEHLEIPLLAPDTPELAIPTLKTFQVEYVQDVNQWRTFLMNNPSLETVAIQWIQADVITYEVLDAITQRLQKLKNMKFGAKFKPTQRSIEMMHRNCPRDFQPRSLAGRTKERKHKRWNLQSDLLSPRSCHVNLQSRIDVVVSGRSLQSGC
jgi:hypothetical protein